MTPGWQPSDSYETPSAKGNVPLYNPAIQDHFFIVGIAYRWTPKTIHLDQENQVMISAPACLYCFQDYTAELATTPCLGPPPP
jgi:hypothetical protein